MDQISYFSWTFQRRDCVIRKYTDEFTKPIQKRFIVMVSRHFLQAVAEYLLQRSTRHNWKLFRFHWVPKSFFWLRTKLEMDRACTHLCCIIAYLYYIPFCSHLVPFGSVPTLVLFIDAGNFRNSFFKTLLLPVSRTDQTHVKIFFDVVHIAFSSNFWHAAGQHFVSRVSVSHRHTV